MKKLPLLILGALCIYACNNAPQNNSFSKVLSNTESMVGKPEYLASPYLTPGDKTYMVGHQDGTFPDLGWHVTGEMGGIWNHPIKLMDGFSAQISKEGADYCLDSAKQFVNYPFANSHEYEVEALKLTATRKQFVPDGEEAVYVEYELTNNSEKIQKLTFTFNGFVDLRPVWLGERSEMIDAKDEVKWNESIQGIEGKDANNDWHVVYASTLKPVTHELNASTCDYERNGMGANASLSYTLEIPPYGNAVIPFVIAGSDESRAEAISSLKKVQANAGEMLQTKANRYQVIANQAKLTVPDKKLEEAFRWVKYNTDWLINDVNGLGRGITAGNPDYPWFFGADSEYALQGAMAIGMKDIVYSTIQMIDSVSNAENNGSGKIIHEMSTNGVVFNPGNLNETPQYATLIWEVFKWTGDREFLRKYYPTVEAGLDWLLKENDEDGNLLADGYGMMEIHGLESEMIDVAAYTYKAFVDAAEMAEVLGKTAQAENYRSKAEKLAEIINNDFWVGEFSSYADFIGTAKDAKHLIEGAIVRADTLNKPWAVEELKATQRSVSQYSANKKQGFVLYHNWVVNTPMEVGVADPEKAIKALNTGSKYVNPFGMFVTGIDRDESVGTDDSGFAKKMKIFSYTGAVMTLPTGVQAIAENNYGRPDNALEYLQRMTNSFSYALPGSMYEVSPDFGMHAQAWNIYSYAVPLVKQFFGIEPMAHLNQAVIQPKMPSIWEEASLERIQVGNNELSISYRKTAEGVRLVITQTDAAFRLVFPHEGASIKVIQGNLLNETKGQTELSGAEVEVLIN
ncbi:glycogen debranching protein [Roseivirga pacifica]|uniref:alpha-L-rhamnosidase-related protein n=1 Tax=Roseivirga pacifica TaxID=1267423 RepID=UPI003BAE951F